MLVKLVEFVLAAAESQGAFDVGLLRSLVWYGGGEVGSEERHQQIYLFHF